MQWNRGGSSLFIEKTFLPGDIAATLPNDAPPFLVDAHSEPLHHIGGLQCVQGRT